MKKMIVVLLTVFFAFAATASADGGYHVVNPAGNYDLRAGILCFSSTPCEVTIKLHYADPYGQPGTLVYQTTRTVSGSYTELRIPVGYLSGNYITDFTYSNYNCTLDNVHLMPTSYS
ncbi:hypothetical protein D3P07_17690 [Paenibacillus sp. 1011MAR3C5]|uniref:hypothetical protein n=1 Tax=Paenibacillus sp. 1011MAR3C5 TaxID=1675787 RepID=UPI000E6B7E91|nr:hypothetical protein [Paenibacillus sp. 1011MAR3C5]RJE87006.1 hypothetical protein D3P07_17690 [Paenibacillus sp. 1011MAR3C5]